MKITESSLRRIIREETRQILKESYRKHMTASQLAMMSQEAGEEGLADFFDREARRSRDGDKYYVLERKRDGSYDVYTGETVDIAPQFRVNISSDAAGKMGMF